jgi:hypothetical protein
MINRSLLPTEKHQMILTMNILLKQYTITELSKGLGYSRQIIYAWMKGERCPSLTAMEVLSNFVHLKLSKKELANIALSKAFPKITRLK